MIAEALKSLRPAASWALSGDDLGGLLWLDSQQDRPTDDEITAECTRLVLLGAPVTAADVRAEAQRRIIAATGATDFNGCIVKQLNANMRATEITNKIANGEPMTPEEHADTIALRALAERIRAIRAASNVMEAAPPLDYMADARWP